MGNLETGKLMKIKNGHQDTGIQFYNCLLVRLKHCVLSILSMCFLTPVKHNVEETIETDI